MADLTRAPNLLHRLLRIWSESAVRQAVATEAIASEVLAKLSNLPNYSDDLGKISASVDAFKDALTKQICDLRSTNQEIACSLEKIAETLANQYSRKR